MVLKEDSYVFFLVFKYLLFDHVFILFYPPFLQNQQMKNDDDVIVSSLPESSKFAHWFHDEGRYSSSINYIACYVLVI